MVLPNDSGDLLEIGKSAGKGPSTSISSVHTQLLVEMLGRMLVIRSFDSLLPSLYTKGHIRGSSHAAIGQEAVAVGACFALEPTDYITSTHRGHGHAIAKGADIKKMMAELLGKVDGYSRGKGGSMHIADFSIGMLGANGIVGGGLGIAAGAALSAQLQGNGRVTVCFFGEGALNQGVFSEVANIAAIWRLPLVLLCENNQYEMSARVSAMVSVQDVSQRASAFGFPGVSVDGMDVLSVYDAVKEAVSRARRGDGPSLVVATCYRLEGHFSGDTESYRSKDEVKAWWKRDPVETFTRRLVESGVLTAADASALRTKASDDVAAALEFALESDLPEPAELFEDVYG